MVERCGDRKRPVRAIIVVAVVVALTGISACGGTSSGIPIAATKVATGGKISVGAYDLFFDVGTIETSPGPLSVTLVNHGAVEHTLKIEGTSLDLAAFPGGTATATVTLRKGTYLFECTIPGHSGMRGKVQVS